MEMEFFVPPGTDEEWHQYWIEERFDWYTGLGIRPENLRLYEHPKEKLSHYSKRTVDIEYRFEFIGSEWGELEGIANRTDYDLTTHQQASGRTCPTSTRRRASGTCRTSSSPRPASTAARWCSCSTPTPRTRRPTPRAAGEAHGAAARPRLAPVKAAVLPLSRNADLSPKARDLAAELRKRWNNDFDDARRSAAGTGGRTRSARRTASPSTSTPWTTRP